MFRIALSAATAFEWFSVHNLAVLHNQVVVVHTPAEEVVVHTPAEEVVVRSPAEEVAVRTLAGEVRILAGEVRILAGEVRILAEEVAVRTLAVLPDHMAAVDDFADHIPAAEVVHSPVAHNSADVVEAGSYNLGHYRERHIDLAEVRQTVVPPKDESFARLSCHKMNRSHPSII